MFTPDGKVIIKGRETRVQATSRPDRIFTEQWAFMSRPQQRKELKYAEEIKRAREVRQREGLRVWAREDDQARVFRTTLQSGPKWNTVE